MFEGVRCVVVAIYAGRPTYLLGSTELITVRNVCEQLSIVLGKFRWISLNEVDATDFPHPMKFAWGYECEMSPIKYYPNTNLFKKLYPQGKLYGNFLEVM